MLIIDLSASHFLFLDGVLHGLTVAVMHGSCRVLRDSIHLCRDANTSRILNRP